MPSPTPRSTRGTEPNPENTTTSNPTINNLKNSGVGEVKSGVIQDINGDNRETMFVEVMTNTTITTKKVKKNTIMLMTSFTSGIPEISFEKIGTCQ
jgi:hypothetical protein